MEHGLSTLREVAACGGHKWHVHEIELGAGGDKGRAGPRAVGGTGCMCLRWGKARAAKATTSRVQWRHEQHVPAMGVASAVEIAGEGGQSVRS